MGYYRFPSLLFGKGTPDTTPDGRQLFAIFSDSRGGDSSSSVTLGPTTIAGTCGLWNGSTITDLTTADMNNAGPTHGTPWKKFALDYNANSAYKCVFVNRAAAGSEIYPDGDNNNWYTSGTLYSAAVTDVNAALAYMGLTKPRGIFVILGANDANGAQSNANIQTGITSLITRLNSDFPGVNIYISMVGKHSASSISSKAYTINGYWKDNVDSNPLVHCAFNTHNFVDWGYMDADNIHWTQTGNNKVGEIYSRYLLNPETNKAVRQVQNCFFNSQLINYPAIKTFVEGCISDGNWDTTVDMFQFYHPTDTRDKVSDWTLMTAARRVGSADGDGTNFYHSLGTAGNYISSNFAPAFARRASQNDFLKFIKTGTVTTGAGTAGVLFSEGSSNRLNQAGGSVIQYGSNDATATSWTGGDTSFQSNSEYANGRSSSTAKFLKKDGTQVHSASVSSGSPTSNVFTIGEVSGSTAYLNAQYKYAGYVKNSAFNHSAFLSRIATLIAAWQ